MGVLGVVPGQIGLVQAMEILKLILKVGNPLIGKFLLYGALNAYFDVMTIGRNPDCPLCGSEPKITKLGVDSNSDACTI